MAKRRTQKRWKVKELIEAYGIDAVRKGAEYVNSESKSLKDAALKNMQEQGIKSRTGNLVKHMQVEPIVLSKITPKTKKAAAIVLNDATATNKKGEEIAYGRIIEFSPRINKPFFYTEFYNRRAKIRENLEKIIREAWVKGGKK